MTKPKKQLKSSKSKTKPKQALSTPTKRVITEKKINSSKPCDCPNINESNWNWRWHDWNTKYFYSVGVSAFFYSPIGIADKYKQLFKEIASKGFKLADSHLILHKNGMFSGRLMAEIKSPHIKSRNVTVMQNKSFATRVFVGPYTKLGGEVKAVINKLKIKPKSVYFWYTTCPKCVNRESEHKTVIFIEI